MAEIDPRLQSAYLSPLQLIAIGRIAELSAMLERWLRNMLAEAIGAGTHAGDALFLGDRASSLVARIKAVGEFEDRPEWFRGPGVDWAKDVGKAIEQRDSFIHRSPIMLSGVPGLDEDEHVLGLDRARRNHQAEPLTDEHLLNLVERLYDLERWISTRYASYLGWEGLLGEPQSPFGGPA